MIIPTEILIMNWYKKAQEELFRGDSSPINIENYDHEYASKVLGKELGSSMAWGPGIYFANKQDVATMYGSNITRKTINNAKILTPQSPPFTHKQIDKIISGTNREKLLTAVSNWDENYNIGKKLLIDSIVSDKNPLNQLMNIWADVFMHQDPNGFIELMVRNGIDGISLQKEDVIYYVIYNHKILQ